MRKIEKIYKKIHGRIHWVWNWVATLIFLDIFQDYQHFKEVIKKHTKDFNENKEKREYYKNYKT